jgi:uncharacterized membrane protein
MVTITSEENLVTQKECNDKEKCIDEKLDARLKSVTFYWIIGVLIGIVSGVFSYTFSVIGSLNSRVEAYQISASRIESQLAQIQTDLAWIKITLKK